LSVSLGRLGGALSALGERAAAGDAAVEAGLSALSAALEEHRATLARQGEASARHPEQLAALVRNATQMLDRDLSAQLQQCISAVMAQSHEAAGRHASDSEKLEAIASVVEELREEVGSVRQLADEQRDLLSIIEERGNFMPHTFVILPEAHPPLKKSRSARTVDKIKNFLLRKHDQAVGLLWDRSRLFFVCPVTREVVPCGPDGKGYLIKVPKAVLRALAPALQWGVFFLKLALATQGLGAMVPSLPADLSNWSAGGGMMPLGDVVSQLSADLAAAQSTVGTVGGVAKDLFLIDDQDSVVDQLDQMSSSFNEWEAAADERAKKAFAQVFQFVAVAEGAADYASNRTWRPAHTGLVLTRPSVGASAWVSVKGQKAFQERGWAAVAVRR
jgi:hypothetical protein